MNTLIGAQVFERAKIYKATWTKTNRRLVLVLRWNKQGVEGVKNLRNQ